jgi:hypothetical protein
MLLWTISLTSCASSLKQLPPLEKRALRIDLDKAQFVYQYEKCKRKFIIKKCWIEKIYYDFTDPAIRKELKDKGFKLKVVR